MLKNITGCLSLSLLTLLLIFTEPTQAAQWLDDATIIKLFDKYGMKFASLEHRNLGDAITLRLNETDVINHGEKLTLPNGLKLSYGEIVMLAGDYFGYTRNQISTCSKENQPRCFRLQFAALAENEVGKAEQCSSPLHQVNALLDAMNQIDINLVQSRQNGIPDWVYYENHNTELSKNFNRITCGGSMVTDYLPYGQYIKLAQVNLDHFAPDSLVAYQVGHRYALKTAIAGFKKREQGQLDEAMQLLVLAYAQNAFANHYLTDSFSAGHMRTPRRTIAHDVFLPAALNLLIANLMHDEDNKHGLNVVNAEGTSFFAYGDGYLVKPEAMLQKQVILETMQRSADGIYEAYATGQMPSQLREMSLFPLYDKIEQLNTTAPLFKVVDGVLMKRVNNADYYDFHWTAYWNGLITLLQFKL